VKTRKNKRITKYNPDEVEMPISVVLLSPFSTVISVLAGYWAVMVWTTMTLASFTDICLTLLVSMVCVAAAMVMFVPLLGIFMIIFDKNTKLKL
jgi:hypothetical protein